MLGKAAVTHCTTFQDIHLFKKKKKTAPSTKIWFVLKQAFCQHHYTVHRSIPDLKKKKHYINDNC